MYTRTLSKLAYCFCVNAKSSAIAFLVFFKFTHMLFQWLFIWSIKVINRLIRKGMSNIYLIIVPILTLHLCSWMFFRSIKEIIRLLNRGMSTIYLVPIEKTWPSQIFWFSKFKLFVSRLVFRELQFTQILLNYKTSCCNLKIRGLGKNHVRLFSICVSFLRYFILSRTVPRF